ncbi:Uncharacterised protein [Mycobacteroides abscessus subsp. abscessus]|nr:Uncharacterised protein [Mycobacteroides abscessus subsp. abscessus]
MRNTSASALPAGVSLSSIFISGYRGSSPSSVANAKPEPTEPSEVRMKLRWLTTMPSSTVPLMFNSGA